MISYGLHIHWQNLSWSSLFNSAAIRCSVSGMQSQFNFFFRLSLLKSKIASPQFLGWNWVFSSSSKYKGAYFRRSDISFCIQGGKFRPKQNALPENRLSGACVGTCLPPTYRTNSSFSSWNLHSTSKWVVRVVSTGFL